MSQLVLSPEGVIAAVSHAVRGDAFKVVAIGGNTWSGKTTLARSLTNELNFECLHLDDFINASPGIDLPRVKHEIDRRRAASRPVLIEGVGVRRVLTELNLKPDLLIYLTGSRVRQEQVSDEFYRENTTLHPLAKLIGYYDDQNSSREAANILVVFG